MGLAFVGRQREEVVDQLLREWDVCREEQRSLLVLVEGHPGVGKTRIVQEFYDRLRATQDEPAYWPPMVSEDDELTLQDRGRIRPLQFICPAGARPDYAWVAVSCRLDDVTGLPLRALVEAVGASESLMERIIRPLGRTRRLVSQAWRISMVLVGVAVMILSAVGVGGLAAFIPGLVVAATGTFFELREQVRGTATEITHMRRERSRQEVMIDVAQPLQEVSLGAHARASGFLTALAKRGIPAVVVIDDAQWADEDTVDLVDALLGRSIPALIIGTVRPTPFEDQFQQRRGLGRVARDYGTKTRRLTLEPLSITDLVTAILARAPRTRADVAAALAAHSDGNPIVLAGTLDQPIIRRSLTNGAYDMHEPVKELADLPKDPRGVFDSYWEQLPEPVAQLIAFATIHGNLVETTSLSNAFRVALDRDPSEPLAAARDPYFWLSPMDVHLDRFADPLLFDAGVRHAHSVVSESELRRARAEVVATTLRLRTDNPNGWTTLPDHAKRVLLAVHVRSVRDGSVAVDGDAASSAISLGALLDGPAEAAVSLEIAELGALWAGLDRGTVDQAHEVCAERLRELGRQDDLIALLPEVIEFRAREFGVNALETLTARRRLAQANMRMGRLDVALSHFDELVPAFERHVGSHELETLETRRQQAMCLRAMARVDAATELFEAIIAEDAEYLGPDHRETLIASNELAKVYMDKGRLQESMALFRTVLDGRTRVVGPDHPDTLKTRSDFANLLFVAGRYDEAYREAEDVLAVRQWVCGPDHQETLRTRGTIALLLWRQSRLPEAIDLSRVILDDATRVLGPAHPETLRYRNNLSAMYGTAGRIDEALAEFELLFADQCRLLGPEHRETFRTRGNIACALADLHRYDESFEMFHTLIDDEVRVLGENDPDTFFTRQEFANALGNAGDTRACESALRTLTHDKESALGSEHPDTLRCKIALAEALATLGDVDEAATVLRNVVEVATRTLGADNAITSSAAHELGELDPSESVTVSLETTECE